MSSAESLVLFDVSKSESSLPTKNCKKLARLLKRYFRVAALKEFTSDALFKSKMLILLNPQSKFTAQEGNAVLYFGSGGGESKNGSNLNYFLEHYGISILSDSVVRVIPDVYNHPKEVRVSGGVANRGLIKYMRKDAALPSSEGVVSSRVGGVERDGSCPFVYPSGASLSVQSPAIPLLLSSNMCIPSERTLCAACEVCDDDEYEYDEQTKGRIVVIGSVNMVDDEWIEKENNLDLIDVVVRWAMKFTDDTIPPVSLDKDEVDINDYTTVPDISSLADDVQGCLMEGMGGDGGGGHDEIGDTVSADVLAMLKDQLHVMDSRYLPEIEMLYSRLSVPYEPLSLIEPEFNVPLPNPKPALFPPLPMDPPPPALELYDLDDEFANEKSRLAQLTNKCAPADLSYYIEECGKMLDIQRHLSMQYGGGDGQPVDAKAILEYVMKKIVEYKKPR